MHRESRPMIGAKDLTDAMYAAMVQAAVTLPPDVEERLRLAHAEEMNPLALEHLAVSLENARLAGEGKGLVCGDTGFPLYFVKVGRDCDVEGGFGCIRKAAEQATGRATADSYLRPTMVDPLDRSNPGDNVGRGMPRVKLRFDESVSVLDIIAAPKGGGSEIFGTFYRMLFPSDGTEGVKKFVLESVRDGCYAGKICPPAIVGVGIGGTADLCMELAKEGALLRPVGSRNPSPAIAELEDDLLAACRELGVGPMGSRGVNSAMAVHVECAVTHTAALPVAVNAQCLIGRRWRVLVDPEGGFELAGDVAGWYTGV